MLLSFLFLTVVGGTISALLTTDQITPPPLTVQSLRGESIGALNNSIAAEVMRTIGANITLLQTPSEGYLKIIDGNITYFAVSIIMIFNNSYLVSK
jgi:hypothetical protein